MTRWIEDVKEWWREDKVFAAFVALAVLGIIAVLTHAAYKIATIIFY